MKRLFLLLLATASLLACGTQPKKLPSGELTVITYNVGAFSKYAESSMPEIAAFIQESGASLVALNELDSCNNRHNTFQLEDLARQVGDWHFLFGRAIPYAGGAYGNGVLSREPIVKEFVLALPKADGAEDRSCAIVETEHYVFAAAHLDHVSSVARVRQAYVINEWFKRHYNGCEKPVILCGDMNATPDSEAIAQLEGCWTRLSGTDFTHSTKNPKICIDYIFSFKQALPVKQVLDIQIPQKMAGASDHFPIVLKLRY